MGAVQEPRRRGAGRPSVFPTNRPFSSPCATPPVDAERSEPRSAKGGRAVGRQGGTAALNPTPNTDPAEPVRPSARLPVRPSARPPVRTPSPFVKVVLSPYTPPNEGRACRSRKTSSSER